MVEGRDWILRMQDGNRILEGDAIHWDTQSFFVLGRDGQLNEFDIDRAPDAVMVTKPFYSFSQAEMKASLQAEYGSAFDVSGTGHYLVVHPAGQRDKWASRFEDLYREMVHYFATRQIPVTEPKFPLVAVVFPTQSQFYEHAQADGLTANGVLGYYSWLSNRVLLYDQSNGRGDRDWRETNATVVHEAAHQTAFNTGVHRRWANPPAWICEGLGTLFEARGVNNSRQFPRLHDRVNQRHFGAFQRYFAEGLPPGTLKALVASDDLIRQQPLPAYAAAWATTFYLAERHPSQLASYLRRTARRSGFFRPASPSERLSNFQAVFGDDLEMLEVRVHRFVQQLR